VGTFVVETLVGVDGDVSVLRARDASVDRPVLLRVAHGASARPLLDDARRIAAVSHPALVVLLGAGPTDDDGSFAAVGELDASPLSDAGELTSEEAARVAIDIAGAIDALAAAGARAPISADTVMVTRTPAGVRGFLDPLRAVTPGVSCLSRSDPAASTAELTSILGAFPLSAPRKPASRLRRPALIVVACLVIASAVGVAYEASGGSAKRTAVRHVPAARVVARIPLGLPKNEIALSYASSFAQLGSDIWVATSAGRLVRIPSGANQVVGSPIKLAGKHPLQAVVASGGSLYTADYAGWLLRVNPHTRRVTARRHLSEHLDAMVVQAGVLWIVSNDGSKCAVLRVDAATLRPIGRAVNALPDSFQIVVRGSRAWVLAYVGNTPKVVRVDAVSGERRVASVGPEANEIALDGGTLWITDRINGTVSALDAERMKFTRPPLLTPRASYGVLPVGGDLWITVTDSLDSTGPLRVERFDARSGRPIGDALAVGTHGSSMLYAFGSLWVFTRTAVVRLAPSNARLEGRQPISASGSPHALRPGPLEEGTWSTPAFAAPFTVSTRAFVWLASNPQPDSVELDTTSGVDASLSIAAPRQVFATDKLVRKIGTPASLLRLLRTNPHLLVGAVDHIRVGGHPALRFTLRAQRPAHHSEVCGPLACTLLFPVRDATYTVASGEVLRLSLLRAAGRTLVIFEGGGENGGNPIGLAESAALLRTVHFTA
jgi:hypothetical protein